MPIPAKNQKKTPSGIHKTDKLIWELTVVTKCRSCGSNNWNPGGASWFKKSVAVVPYSGGGPGHHAPGYFLTTRRDPRGQKMKPKGKATPSSLRKWRGARKERVPTISKSDWLFSKNGALPSRRNCRLFSKMTGYFLLAPKLVRRLCF